MKYYGIEVAGVEVTSDNCNNITGKHIFGKKVSYDLKTNTLTLDNVEINGHIQIDSSPAKDITIILVGSVVLFGHIFKNNNPMTPFRHYLLNQK